MAQKRIDVEEQNRKDVQIKRVIASDSLQKFQLQILDLNNNSEVAGELGPLQYLSGLTGYPMDKIINWLLLIIIFVFDPLAISLVVAANFAFDQAYPKRKYKENLYEEKVEVKEESSIWPEDYTEEDERRMNIIGQNGNEGDHYKEENYEEHRLKKKLEHLNEELNSLPKTKEGIFIGQEERRKKIKKEIKKLNQIIK
jgi:hypothetical protein|tara:strand:- start:639 stop:1232 length:594 start_codon:yes stop_codon:yes gene_type:complete